MTGATTITIEISTPSRSPIRRHVSIPPGDQVTQDWFDIQKNPSASVRLLIKDEIGRQGMIDRVTRERFGTPLAQAAARSVQPAGATAVQPPSAAAAVPTPWAAPGLDPRDAEIKRLTNLVADRDEELSRLRAPHDPTWGTFLDALEREGVTSDGLLL